MPSESELVDWIRTQQKSTGVVRVAAGDDLAVLDWTGQGLLVAGADQVLDGVHFDSAVHNPRDIGRKAMNRNLSDCAAMGCSPVAAIVTFALPRGTSIDFAKSIYLGIQQAGERFGCAIAGGDTASWDGKLAITVSILGRAGDLAPITRAGARVGDGIYVTGPLGGSLLGRHLTFEPRIEWGLKLAHSKAVTSMIDISDGLSRDLPRICSASNVGAVVEAARVPVHDDAIAMRRDGHTPLDHALHDGEDYELLFTSDGSVQFAFATRIGTVTEHVGVWLANADGERQLLEPRGWEHAL